MSSNLSFFVFNSVKFILKPPTNSSLSYFYIYTSAISQFGKNRYTSGMNTSNKIISIVITNIGITLTKARTVEISSICVAMSHQTSYVGSAIEHATVKQVIMSKHT